MKNTATQARDALGGGGGGGNKGGVGQKANDAVNEVRNNAGNKLPNSVKGGINKVAGGGK